MHARLAAATILRYGITPYLLMADFTALALGVSAVGGLTGGLLVFAAATVALNAAAAMYRSRLTLSILDQAPDLAVRALAAAAFSSAAAPLAASRADGGSTRPGRSHARRH